MRRTVATVGLACPFSNRDSVSARIPARDATSVWERPASRRNRARSRPIDSLAKRTASMRPPARQALKPAVLLGGDEHEVLAFHIDTPLWVFLHLSIPLQRSLP